MVSTLQGRPGRLKITDVFTPRKTDVNSMMYIARPANEKNLLRSIEGSMHSFLFGESGNGKTWLYKSVFKANDINYVVANCARASMQRSIVEEVYSVSVKENTPVKKGFKEGKKGGVSIGGKAEFSHEDSYEINVDKLLLAYRSLHKRFGKSGAVIVLDNIETILKNEERMAELSDMIILLDDARYSKFSIKFLLVAVPNDVISYFSSSKNPTSVGNRIEECPRLTGLSRQQVREFVSKGFNSGLLVGLSGKEVEYLSNYIFQVTLGIPQRVHELCASLAYEIEDNGWQFTFMLTEPATQNWLLKGLRESYAVVESKMNANSMPDGRRNQVMYAISTLTKHQFDTKDIGNIVSKEFPSKKPLSNTGIGQILASFTKGEQPIIRKQTHSSYYTICDPRYLMCIRAMLVKNNYGGISKKGFSIS